MATTPERRSLIPEPWRFRHMNSFAKAAIGAVVVFAVEASGLSVLGRAARQERTVSRPPARASDRHRPRPRRRSRLSIWAQGMREPQGNAPRSCGTRGISKGRRSFAHEASKSKDRFGRSRRRSGSAAGLFLLHPCAAAARERLHVRHLCRVAVVDEADLAAAVRTDEVIAVLHLHLAALHTGLGGVCGFHARTVRPAPTTMPPTPPGPWCQ